MLKVSSWKIGFLLCAFYLLTGLVASAQVTFTTLYSFCSQTNCTDGAQPVAALIQGSDGNLYGTTYVGGASGWGTNGGGTVFKITTGGELTTLYSFREVDSSWPNGLEPLGALVLATNGDFYGTTSAGGAYAPPPVFEGGGTVFKITSTGSLTTLYSFCAQTNCADGASPHAGLVQATNSDLYGTTWNGGANSNCIVGFLPTCGTIFKITPGGAFTNLYSFCAQVGCPDGEDPASSLIQATSGDLYGTTPAGGTSPDGGTIFKITPGGTLTTLYDFCSLPACADGAQPGSYGAGLVQGADGNFYGTTSVGGNCTTYNGLGYGTIFKLTPAGKLTTLHSFGNPSCGDPEDGTYPNPGLIQATDGNFYGTTQGSNNSGAPDSGTVFKITPGGTLTTLYYFCSLTDCADGAFPFTGVVQGTDGNFLGTTYEGGANGLFYGTVFKLSVDLEPFVETNPTSGAAGTKVTILGNNLTGTTSVTFNGTAATFTVNSTGTAITTTVPNGATTGYVKVTRPSGILTSNVKFRVP